MKIKKFNQPRGADILEETIGLKTFKTQNKMYIRRRRIANNSI